MAYGRELRPSAPEPSPEPPPPPPGPTDEWPELQRSGATDRTNDGVGGGWIQFTASPVSRSISGLARDGHARPQLFGRLQEISMVRS